MATYTYRTYDLRTNRFLGEFPMAGCTYSEGIGENGSLSGTIPVAPTVRVRTSAGWVPAGDLINYSTLDVASIYQTTVPTRTAIYVDRDGVLVWGGIIWTRRPNESGSIEIGADGFLSLYERRKILVDRYYNQADQAAIVRDILVYAEAQYGGEIGLTYGTEMTGVLRDRDYWGTDRATISTVLKDLTALQNGFDLRIAVGYSGASPYRLVQIGYPYLGRAPGTSGLVWDYDAQNVPGGAIASYTWPEDGTRMLTRALGRGDSSDFPILSMQTANDLLDAGWPLLEEETTYSDIQEQATLDEHTALVLASRRSPATLPSVVLNPDADPGGYAVGDWVLVNITDPLQFPSVDPNVPGMSQNLRIVSRSVTAAGSDAIESTSVTLNTTAVPVSA